MNVNLTVLFRFRCDCRKISAALSAFLGIAALGVSFSPENVHSQTLQLPSFQHFDASTTVQVPDGGSAYTAGITRSSSGERVTGTPILPFQNRSFGSDSSVSSMHTSVQIIDLQEMDEQILNSPSPVRVRRPNESLAPADLWSGRETLSASSFGGFSSVRDSIRENARLQEQAGRHSSENGRGPERAGSERLEELRRPLQLDSEFREESPRPHTGSAGPSELHADLDLASDAPGKDGRDEGAGRAGKAGKAEKAEKAEKTAGKAGKAAKRSPRSERDPRQETALKLAQKGFSAEKSGKTALALSYYEQAEELAVGKLLTKIQKRRHALLEQ
ncbi:MAG: hypothetical protein IJD43_00185 [Thermoguttaceae bacterium]|nr:hypothetical protein [Thermoguttaceae bacterium]